MDSNIKYIFVAGAPGSRWSGVAKGIYTSPDVDSSDYNKVYIKPGESQPMHVGAYWDPGMEYGNNFDILDTISKDDAEQEFNKPFTQNNKLVRIIKSHQFCKHLEYIKNTWPGCPIVLVYYENDDTTERWWYEAGGFDITYPNYEWYRNIMRNEIEIQNKCVLDFIKNNKCVKFSNSDEICKYLDLDSGNFVNFSSLGAFAYVYK